MYPEGRADVVGYWAEDRILGGVAVYERLQQAGSADPPNAYFHSCRDRMTDRVYQLRDEQQQALFGFLLAQTSSPPPSPCPLPILGDKQNRVRVDAAAAIEHAHIYRDVWERKPITREELLFLLRRPMGKVDYPAARDFLFSVNEQAGIPLPPRRRSPSPTDE